MNERLGPNVGGATKHLALVTVLTGLLVALLGFLAPPASASPLPHPQTRVAAIEQPAGQFVGPHSSVLAAQGRERAPTYDQHATGSSVAAEGEAGAATEVPESAQQVLDYVETHNGEAPPGYVGDRPFGNYEGRRPASDANGSPITYREYDVNQYQQGVNRGAERIVVGSNGSAYYTNDHYTTFVPIP